MLIQIQQDELEEAVRDYVIKTGISRPVGDINFTATRSGGAGIVTEIKLGDLKTADISIPRTASENKYSPPEEVQKTEKEAEPAKAKTPKTGSVFGNTTKEEEPVSDVKATTEDAAPATKNKLFS